jgi:hypothetical protein
MDSRRARTFLRWASAVAIGSASVAPALPAQRIPAKLADTTFWRLVTEFSETNGFFRSDNFVSNEMTLQWVIPELQRTTKPGGAYLGVGPDQNFPYIIALEPAIAFVFDIRRQNMLTHLMYKALIEQSRDRADFLSRLFSRPRPPGVDTTTVADSLFATYEEIAADSSAYRRNLASIYERLERQHGFTISPDDSATIAYVYGAFVTYGPAITYDANQRSGFGRSRMPTFAELQVASDSSERQRGYLADEAAFRTLKRYELNNLIVPLVGDFAGPKAIRAVGDYLRQHNTVVTAFYLSNVEQYLFNQDDDWRKFYTNAGTLPLDSTSTFIRSAFNGMAPRRDQRLGYFMRSQQLLASMMHQLALFSSGKLLSYYDVLQTSR